MPQPGLYLTPLKKHALLLPILCCLLAVTKHAGAQSDTQYKIAVYEYTRSGGKDWYKKNYSYQIRNLFRREGNIWEAATDPAKTQYYLVFKGQKFTNVKGFCCQPTPGYWYQEFDTLKNSGRFLKAHPIVNLSKNHISKPFENNDADLIKKAVLLSSNMYFKQNTNLSNYIPTQNELKTLLDSSKTYLASLYRKNNACVRLFHDFIDTVIAYEIDSANHILIDSFNCFIDNNGNKLLNILFPTDYRWRPISPFVGECQQEDALYYFKILCYITNSGKISFIGDNLQYLDHGDFDNDGKDEFLFWTSRHNHDGYVMYYDDFKKNVELKWSYH
jgi:hypothetical protein